MPRPLPRELVDQILNEVPDKDKRTLARCCLLNKSFRRALHKRLYHLLNFELVSGDEEDWELNASSWRPVDWRLSPSTLLLLSTLQLSNREHLAALVGAVRFSLASGGQSCGVCMTPQQLFSSVLELCPELLDIQLPDYDGREGPSPLSMLDTWNRTLYPDRVVVRLDLRYPQDGLCDILYAAAEYLQELVFSDRDTQWRIHESLSRDVTWEHPLELHTIHIHSPPGGSSDVLAVLDHLTEEAHGTLKTLTIPYEPAFRLSPFTKLSSLAVYFRSEEPIVRDLDALTRWVAAAPALRSLSFIDSLESSMEELVADTAPLANLPSSLAHLHLPADFLPDDFLLLLPKLRRCPLLRTVSYLPRGYQLREEQEEEWDAVEELYWAKGILLRCKTDDED
ncbi:hypothetical protein JCM6882_008284 [Rhodosporidiobolus microsporus]